MSETTTNQERTLDSLLREVPIGRERVVDLAKQLLGEGKEGVRLTIGERKLCPEQPPAPLRKESPRRSHVFHDVAGFGEYLAKYGGADTCIYVDVPAQRITGVLNERANYGIEYVVLEPQPHPQMAPWLNVFGKAIELRHALEFFRQNHRVIASPHGRDLVMVLSQVRMAREITMHEGRGKTCLNGLLVKTTIQGQKQDEVIELPDMLVLAVPLYVSMPAQQFEVDLLVDASSDQRLTALITCADYNVAKIKAFEEMVAELRKMDCEEMVFAFGKPQWANWDYQPTNHLGS